MSYTDLTNTFTYNRRIIATEFAALAGYQPTAYAALNNANVSAYGGSDQTFSSSSSSGAAVNFNTVDFDPQSSWDTTNFRWTPTVAGLYFINVGILFNAATVQIVNYAKAVIRKNGAVITVGGVTVFQDYKTVPATKELGFNINGFLNITSFSDYYDVVFAKPDATGWVAYGGIEFRFFQAIRLAAAL